MKNRLLVLLLVLVLAVVSGVGLISAQDSTMIKALVVDGATLYAEPSDAAEVVAELAAGDVVNVLAADGTGAWLQVEGDAGAGYVMLDSVVVLDLPLLAPRFYVTDEAGTTLTTADGDSVDLPAGTVATVLGTQGEQAYIETTEGRGWSPLAAWADAAEIARSVTSRMATGGVVVYDSPKLNAEPIATLAPGTTVYAVASEADEFYTTVFVPGLGEAFIQSKNLSDPVAMSGTFVEVKTNMATGGVALYSEPKLNAEPIAVVDPGTALMWVGDADGFFSTVNSPAYGEVYIQSKNLGNPFVLATVQVQDAVVRAGPNDNVYEAVALLPAGTTVVVKGISASGVWLEVAIPFSEVDWPSNGVSGWMRDFLFVDANAESDLVTDNLVVTE